HGGYAVSLQFTVEGSDLFAEGTRLALAGREPAFDDVSRNAIVIILDNEIISAPVVHEVINSGSCVITSGRVGGFPQDEAGQLSALIRGGALPVELHEINSCSQTASIGETAFEKSVVAGAIGLALIFVIMILAYSVMGIAACIALLLYVIIVLWVMVGLGAVLTLPGIAGIILSIGMAVDANVVIFSRIREEIINGKTVRVAVQSGFKRALATVMDSQITTIIAALVLYEIGTSTVKGFSLTLMIGIVASLFTAVVVTNLYLSLIADSKVFSKKSFYGVNEDNTPKFGLKKEIDFVKNKKFIYIIACSIIIVGLLVSTIFGMNYGIDFTGGTKIQIDLGQYVDSASIEKTIDSYDLKDLQIVYSGNDKHEVIIKTTDFLENDQRAAVVDTLQEAYDFPDSNVLTSEQFSPSVGSELQKNAVIAVLIAAIGMLIYIIIRFEWKFGIAAVAGVFHDVLMVIAFYAIFRVTVNNPFIAGILTVVGYSINDTIVIFDRIRENLGLMKKKNTTELVNKSINQTIGRSIMTSVTTLVVMIPMLVMTGDAIREFTVPLMAGVVVGCVSSITICAPLWLDITNKTGGSKYKGATKKSGKRAGKHKEIEAETEE
ncbi:MAG: protein translocase subunit SecF, partial [Firmicutes bacterium]|nr:protein translocase subunit SecF [Bacillota bacterium]